MTTMANINPIKPRTISEIANAMYPDLVDKPQQKQMTAEQAAAAYKKWEEGAKAAYKKWEEGANARELQRKSRRTK
jgi:hypothetical protein